MSSSFFRRFDITACRDFSVNNNFQVPLSLPRVDFYKQGATVSASVTIANGSSGSVSVYDGGLLQVGDFVMAGVGGQKLSVTAISGPTQITLSNSSGYSATIAAGTRLIALSNRPTAYQDQHGTVSLGNSVTGDNAGRVTCYIDATCFDYIVSGPPVIFDSTSSQTLTGNGPTMSWSHTASGADLIVLVAVAFQDNTGEESISSVTYDGHAMSALSGGDGVFYLVNPPTGSKTIVVTFSGSSPKGAVAGAMSFMGVDPSSRFGVIRAATGNNTGPSVTVTGTHPNGILFNSVGIIAGAATTSLTVAGSQNQKWNASAGSAPAVTLTQGGGCTAAGTGDAFTLSWTLGASKVWSMVGVEVRPVAVRLVIVGVGPDLAWVNVRDYPTFQAAIDALPPSGGVVYVPAGTYTRTTLPAVVPMTISRPTVLLGDITAQNGAFTGTRIVYRNNATEDLDSNLITVSGHNCDYFTIRNISLEGAGAAGNGCGLVIDTVYDVTIKDCNFQDFPSWGIKSGDGTDIVNCVFDHVGIANSHSDGLMQLGKGTASCFSFKIANCNFIPAVGRCVELGVCEFMMFDKCTFQTQMADHTGQEMLYVDPTPSAFLKLVVRDCWFENKDPSASPSCWMIHIIGPTLGVTIENCVFSRVVGPPGSKALRAINTVDPGVYNLMIANNLGDLAGHGSTGTDDLVVSTGTTPVTLMNNSIRDSNSYANAWRVSGLHTLDARVSDGRRNKAPTASDQAQVDSITDPVRGDMVYNNANDGLNVYSASGKWRHVGLHIFSGSGQPSSGKFKVGDMAYNTSLNKIYVCTVEGETETWVATAALS
jgi:hypothetical protein